MMLRNKSQTTDYKSKKKKNKGKKTLVKPHKFNVSNLVNYDTDKKTGVGVKVRVCVSS